MRTVITNGRGDAGSIIFPRGTYSVMRVTEYKYVCRLANGNDTAVFLCLIAILWRGESCTVLPISIVK